MIDDSYRDALRGHGANQCRESGSLIVVEASSRFISKEKTRLTAKRYRQSQPAQVAEAQVGSAFASEIMKANEVQDPVGVTELTLAITAVLAGNPNVLANGKRRKRHRLLESTADACLGNSMRRLACDVFSQPPNRPDAWGMYACDYIEKCRLARSVWANDPKDLAFIDMQVDTRQRCDAAEMLLKPLDLKQNRHSKPQYAQPSQASCKEV